MTTTDRYCQNCRQIVAPRHPIGIAVRGWAFGVMAAFMAFGLLAILRGIAESNIWVTLLVWGMGAAVLAVAAFRPRPSADYCPICKSRSLSEAPAA